MHRIVLFFFITFLTSCSNLLFVPIKPYPVTPDAAGLLYEDVFIDAQDGVTLHGWKIHADEKTAGTIVFFHGNGDNVSTQMPNTFWLAKEGYDLYVFDYREYGQSQGEADLDAIISDMELMIGHIAEELPVDEKMIVMGHSLGGAMSVYVVAHSLHRDKIEALITVEAFSDYHDVTQEALSKSWLLWLFQWPLSFTIDNSYRPLDSIGLISPIPVAIIHSESDEMIEMYHAEALFEAAREPKEFILIDSNHSNVFVTKNNRQILFDYLKMLKE
jgi:alpha-beta hydrolase superfamily lysophospholipase